MDDIRNLSDKDTKIYHRKYELGEGVKTVPKGFAVKGPAVEPKAYNGRKPRLHVTLDTLVPLIDHSLVVQLQ